MPARGRAGSPPFRAGAVGSRASVGLARPRISPWVQRDVPRDLLHRREHGNAACDQCADHRGLALDAPHIGRTVAGAVALARAVAARSIWAARRIGRTVICLAVLHQRPICARGKNRAITDTLTTSLPSDSLSVYAVNSGRPSGRPFLYVRDGGKGKGGSPVIQFHLRLEPSTSTRAGRGGWGGRASSGPARPQLAAVPAGYVDRPPSRLRRSSSQAWPASIAAQIRRLTTGADVDLPLRRKAYQFKMRLRPGVVVLREGYRANPKRIGRKLGHRRLDLDRVTGLPEIAGLAAGEPAIHADRRINGESLAVFRLHLAARFNFLLRARALGDDAERAIAFAFLILLRLVVDLTDLLAPFLIGAVPLRDRNDRMFFPSSSMPPESPSGLSTAIRSPFSS